MKLPAAVLVALAALTRAHAGTTAYENDYCSAVKDIHLSLFRIQLEYNLAAEDFALLLAKHAVVEEWEPDHYVDAAYGYRVILNSGAFSPRALAKKVYDKCIAGTLGKRPPPWPQR